MPIRRGSVTLSRFRLSGEVPKDVKKWLGKGLKSSAFEPIDLKSDEERSAGFVEFEFPDRSEFQGATMFHGGHAIFAYRVDKLRIPSNQIRGEMLKWTQVFESKNGRPPARREKTEQKENIRRSLRSKSDPSTRVFEVSVDLSSRDLFIWATSRTIVEEIVGVLESALEIRLHQRVAAAFVDPAVLDALTPTPALFGELN